MQTLNKPRLVFFQYGSGENLTEFMQMHRQQHVKCLSEFFQVTIVQKDCDYQEICDRYQPDLTLFEMLSDTEQSLCQKLKITNTNTNLEIPKIAFHNADAWCRSRAGFISDMEHYGIETVFSICTTAAEHTPAIAENLFVWPNFVDTDVYRDYGESKVIPVLITGAKYELYPWRHKIYRLISQYYPSLICPHLGYKKNSASPWQVIHGEQYARTINASWLVPTCGTVAKELVRKHLEIPAAKSCLITEKSPNLEAAGFIDMQNCIFVDEHDVLDKLDYLFKNIDELERITNAGYRLVHSRHTLKQRDQIFQWFNLRKNLKSNQKIVQTSPFEPLTLVDKSLGIKSSHIICNGLNLTLLKQGDEQLWAGKYDEAEVLYSKCLNYIVWMPEPKFRLALCSLFKGNAESALDWILELIQCNFKVYKAADPDPVEWAYFIISLLCLGKLDDAVKRANQFTHLTHPELDRARWAIKSLTGTSLLDISLSSNQQKYRLSIHQLPDSSYDGWLGNLCFMLKVNNQAHLVSKLSNPVILNDDLIKQQQNSLFPPASRTASLQLGYKWNKWVKSKSPEGKTVKFLNYLESRFGYFLPYQKSAVRHDEFFSVIHELAKQEDIKIVLLLGVSITRGSTRSLLAGIQENLSRPVLFCINSSELELLKIQKGHFNTPSIKIRQVSSGSKEDFPAILKSEVEAIRQEGRIDFFDMVLIDRSQLAGSIPVDKILGKSRYILLDGINDTQGHKNSTSLLRDKNYILISHNPDLRNGYAIFKRIEAK